MYFISSFLVVHVNKFFLEFFVDQHLDECSFFAILGKINYSLIKIEEKMIQIYIYIYISVLMLPLNICFFLYIIKWNFTFACLIVVMNNIRKQRQQLRSSSVSRVYRSRAYNDNKVKAIDVLCQTDLQLLQIIPTVSSSQKQTYATGSELLPETNNTTYFVPASKFSIDSLAIIKPLIHNPSSESQLASSTITNDRLSVPTSSCW